ncbi:hypothetical protein [Pasteurella multocida]|uniref:hypothetical protein n=1 Tax=Pasteurella multocida TaxID=747 RepID=UPI002CAA24F2|nr:hypothetical protein [Pasteurella multocida]MEB3457359.1 hypothetical protein [Pasteurella multocida]
MALTKDQILTHALGINLFRTRNSDIARVIFYNENLSNDHVTVTQLIGTNQGYSYTVTTEGKYYTEGGKSAHDLVALITADDLQLLTAPQPAPQPAPNLDLKQCMENHTYLKTRGGEKALVVAHTPGYTYEFRGVVISLGGTVDGTTWTEDGNFHGESIKHHCDIVGLWEE